MSSGLVGDISSRFRNRVARSLSGYRSPPGHHLPSTTRPVFTTGKQHDHDGHRCSNYRCTDDLDTNDDGSNHDIERSCPADPRGRAERLVGVLPADRPHPDDLACLGAIVPSPNAHSGLETRTEALQAPCRSRAAVGCGCLPCGGGSLDSRRVIARPLLKVLSQIVEALVTIDKPERSRESASRSPSDGPKMASSNSDISKEPLRCLRDKPGPR
jgi:hypothetical protein